MFPHFLHSRRSSNSCPVGWMAGLTVIKKERENSIRCIEFWLWDFFLLKCMLYLVRIVSYEAIRRCRQEVWLFVPTLDSWKFACGSLIQDCFKLGSSASYRPSLMQFCLCYRKEDHLPSSSSPHLESSTSLKDLLPNFSLLALLFLCAIFCNICIFEKTIWLLLTQKRFSSQDSHYGS